MHELETLQLLTVHEAAEKIGVSPSSLYAAIKNGKIKAHRILGRTGIPAAEAERYRDFARQHKVKAPEKKASTPTIGEQLMKYSGIFDSGDPMLAENAKEIYHADLVQRHAEGHV